MQMLFAFSPKLFLLRIMQDMFLKGKRPVLFNVLTATKIVVCTVHISQSVPSFVYNL